MRYIDCSISLSVTTIHDETIDSVKMRYTTTALLAVLASTVSAQAGDWQQCESNYGMESLQLLTQDEVVE
jgi:hypothetical protein